MAKIIEEMQDNPQFGDALPPELNINDKELSRKLGRRLAKKEGYRHANGLFVERGGTFRRAIEWRCRLTEGYELGGDSISLFTEEAPY